MIMAVKTVRKCLNRETWALAERPLYNTVERDDSGFMLILHAKSMGCA